MAVHLYGFSIAIYGERQTFFKSHIRPTMEICIKSGLPMVACLHQSNSYIKRKLWGRRAQKYFPWVGAKRVQTSTGLQITLSFHLQQQVLEFRKLSMRILKVDWLVLEHTVSLCYYFMYPLHKVSLKKYSTTSCIMWPFGDHKLVCLVAFTISHKHCVGRLFQLEPSANQLHVDYICHHFSKV